MAVLLGSFFAKLISIGGLVGVVAGFQRTKAGAILGLLVGTVIELAIHASMLWASQVGYLVAPVAVAAAVGIGWGIAGLRRSTTVTSPDAAGTQ